MTREIKFRAWDIEKKRMQIYGFYINPQGQYCDHRDYDICDYDDHILMQYTGLEDMNGKEIYEGDIVEVGSYEGLKIVFQNGKFTPLLSSDDEYDEDWTKEKLNIVGNIYQNPELLTTNQ